MIGKEFKDKSDENAISAENICRHGLLVTNDICERDGAVEQWSNESCTDF